MKQLGLKKNFAWAFAGNGAYQACQWLNLVVLAKFLDPQAVGLFALALAICTPITVFSSLKLRVVQVTDARDGHRFGHFLGLQIIASALATIIIAAVAVFSGYAGQSFWLILTVGVGQAVVLLRDVFIAFNQKQERMDAVALSQGTLGVASLAALGLTVFFTRNLLAGVVAMQAAKLAVFLGYDLRNTARLVRLYTDEAPARYFRPDFNPGVLFALVKLALPLGVTGVLLTLYNNIPRYFIAAFLNEEMLGYFAAILALAMAGDMVTNAAGQSALPRLSRYYLDDRPAFVRLLLKLIAIGAALGLAGLAIVAIFGQTILTVVFTPEYADYNNLFIWSMVYGTTAFMMTFLGYGMSAMRRFRIQPVANIGAVVGSVIAGWLLIPHYGIIGGVWCLLAGKAAQMGLASAVICTGLRGR